MDKVNTDDCININNWDTVIAVNGAEIDVYVRGIKQSNINSVSLEYWVDRLPYLIVRRTPVDTQQIIDKVTKGGNKNV